MLTLYIGPGSSSLAPHIALHEIGASFEAVPLVFAEGETRTPEFLAFNPMGKVPVLLVDGRPLTEVAAILFYLARRFPEARLLPQGDVEAEAQVISWMSFAASTLHPAAAVGGDRLLEVWRIADQKLGTREWTVGDAYSIADIHLFRLYWRIVGWIGFPTDACPNVHRHYEQVLARPAVRKTIEIERAIGFATPRGMAPAQTKA